MFNDHFKDYSKDFFSKFSKLVESNSAISTRKMPTSEHIFAWLYELFSTFSREQCNPFAPWFYAIFRVAKAVANGSLPGEFVPYNYFFGAHHRKAKVSNLFHANLCSFSLLVIVSRLIPLAMLFPGIKRNKYSSVVIDRRPGLYSFFRITWKFIEP